MTQKEKLETLTGEKFPEPTEQDLHKEQIEGTPFWIIGKNKNEWNLIMGKYRMNNTPFQTKEELYKWWHQNTWNITLSLAICVGNDLLTPKTTN